VINVSLNGKELTTGGGMRTRSGNPEAFAEEKAKLPMVNSYERIEVLWRAMLFAPTAADTMAVFLCWGNSCDAPWHWRRPIAELLREDCAYVNLADLLSPEAREYYDSLSDPVLVCRGCEQGRERGLHWTTDRAVALKFAKGMRCRNERPTIAQALIPKAHIFAVFVNRQEHEIVLDPRRLRKISKSPFTDQPPASAVPSAGFSDRG
jgi:hypothetical protein